MIKRFGTLYAGQVDFEDMGFGGTAVNSRWYGNEQAARRRSTRLRSWRRQWTGSDFDTLWFAEHHFQREGYECIPNILMLAVHLAHLTSNLQASAAASTSRRCGTRCAWPRTTPSADVLTKGRVASAWRAATTRARSRPSARPCSTATRTASCSRSRSTSSSRRSTSASFSHHGKHYTCRPACPIAATS